VIGSSHDGTNTIEAARALPLDERGGLAEALCESISIGLPTSDEREAVQQAARRDAYFSSGTAFGRTHDEVMQSARRTIGCD
jgi:hypothetical protein